MKDHVPGKPGRVRVTYDDGKSVEVTLTRADQPVVEGTPLCKETLLPDYVCDTLGIDRETSTPGEALLAVPGVLGKALLKIKATHWDGTGYASMQVTGLTGVAADRCYTDNNGMLAVYVDEGSYTVGSADNGKFFDTIIPSVSVTVAAGQTKEVSLVEQRVADGKGILTITSSVSKQFSRRVTAVDVCLVGAGGKGGNGGDGGVAGDVTGVRDGAGGGGGGAGGGAGGIKEGAAIQIDPNTKYPLTVGSSGGSTSGFGLTAPGGTNGGSGASGTASAGIKAGTGGTGGSGASRGGSGGNGASNQGTGGGGSRGSAGSSSTVSILNGLMSIQRISGDGGGGGGGSGGGGIYFGSNPIITQGSNGTGASGNAGGNGGVQGKTGDGGRIGGGGYGGNGGGSHGGGGGGGSTGHAINCVYSGGNGSVVSTQSGYGAGGNGGGGGGAGSNKRGSGASGTYGNPGVIYLKLYYS